MTDTTSFLDLLMSTASTYVDVWTPGVQAHDTLVPEDDDSLEETKVRGTQDLLSLTRRMHWITSALLAPIIIILGLTGNILSIIVWNRRCMCISTGRYLTGLVSNSLVNLSFVCLL